MPTNVEEMDAVSAWVQGAFQVYEAATEQLKNLGLISQEITGDGSEAQPFAGMGGSLSPSEVGAARRSIDWAISSYEISGTWPDAQALYACVQNTGGSQVAFICTASLLAQGICILGLIAGGGDALVGAEWNVSFLDSEPPSTSPSTFQKMPTAKVNTTSSPPPGRKTRSTQTPRRAASQATSSTSKSSRGSNKPTKKKKAKKRKSSTRKGKQHKGTRK